MCCSKKKDCTSHAWLWLIPILVIVAAMLCFCKTKACRRMMRKMKCAKNDLKAGIENAAEDILGG